MCTCSNCRCWSNICSLLVTTGQQDWQCNDRSNDNQASNDQKQNGFSSNLTPSTGIGTSEMKRNYCTPMSSFGLTFNRRSIRSFPLKKSSRVPAITNPVKIAFPVPLRSTFPSLHSLKFYRADRVYSSLRNAEESVPVSGSGGTQILG